MVFGGVAHDHIQLNEGTVWAGSRFDRNNPKGYEGFTEIRNLLRQGKPVEAEAVANDKMIGVPNRMPQYQTLGDLTIDFEGQEAPTDYRRELDLESSVARVSYRIGDTSCIREYLASAADQVIAVWISCDRPGRVSFTATLTRPADASTDSVDSRTIRMTGEAIPHDERHALEPKKGVGFVAALRAVSGGGLIGSRNGRIYVQNASSVVLTLAAETDFHEKDPAEACIRDLDAAAKPWAVLRKAHVADVIHLFDRMSLRLGPSGAPLARVPTDERIARVADGAFDPGLAALYLEFSRYLLIAGSRPGNLPETLQGLWNDSLGPPWDSKFTININTEMNYWPAEETNLSEMTEPLFDLVETARGPGRITAGKLYHARGFVMHHNTDIWRDTVPIDSARPGIWPMGGAWLSLSFWDHYDYTHDRAFLEKRGYPTMKEAAEFFLDYLTDDGHGHLITGPSASPENRYKRPDGVEAALTMGPYMDTEIVRALFTRVIRSSEILNIDAPFRARVIDARDKLMPFKIGRGGRLQEWIEDYDDAEPGHRHISHLFALFPDDQITPRATPDLAQAARVSLKTRLAHGSGSTGWSRAWIVSYWARLLDGELAWENFQLLLGRSTLPNMFNNGPPFQIDGNFGGAAGLMEMLLQSHSGEIAFLPAIPKDWGEGEVRGMKARGAVGIDLAWKDGRATSATLRPVSTGPVTLRAPKSQRIASVTSGGRAMTATECKRLETFCFARGETYRGWVRSEPLKRRNAGDLVAGAFANAVRDTQPQTAVAAALHQWREGLLLCDRRNRAAHL